MKTLWEVITDNSSVGVTPSNDLWGHMNSQITVTLNATRSLDIGTSLSSSIGTVLTASLSSNKLSLAKSGKLTLNTNSDTKAEI